MNHYRSGSHTKYDIRVHLVWIPKYRKKILTGLVGTYIRDIIRQICTENDWEIVAGKVAPDHIHLFLSIPPHILEQEGEDIHHGSFEVRT